jgi:hypothetical protein
MARRAKRRRGRHDRRHQGASGYLFAGDTTGQRLARRTPCTLRSCADRGSAGTPVALDLAVTEYVYPNVATCDGAIACDATAVFTTKLHSTWNP